MFSLDSSSRRLLSLALVALGLSLSCETPRQRIPSHSCSTNDGCAADEYCEVYGTGGGGGCWAAPYSLGVCVPRTVRGEPCPYDFRRSQGEDVCIPGTICHGAFDPPRCEPPSGAGERCLAVSDCAAEGDAEPICDPSRPPEPHLGVCGDEGTVPEGLPCQEDRACTVGLACRPGRDGSPICRGPGVDGDRCDGAPDGCASGFHCSWEAPRVCRPDLEDGVRCGPGDVCADGLVCGEEDWRCRLASGDGEPCRSNHDCGVGLTCLDGSCALREGEGAACESSETCAAGLRCTVGACARPGLDGDPCEDTRDCAYRLWCKLGACRPGHPWSPEGGVCERTLDCLGGRPCSGGICLPRSDDGGPCRNDRDCSADLWCQPGTPMGACARRLPAGAPCVAEHACRGFACDWTTDPPVCSGG